MHLAFSVWHIYFLYLMTGDPPNNPGKCLPPISQPMHIFFPVSGLTHGTWKFLGQEHMLQATSATYATAVVTHCARDWIGNAKRQEGPLTHCPTVGTLIFFFFWLCLCHVEPQQWQRWITNPMSHQGTPPLHIWPKILYNESSGATNSHRDAKPPKNILRHLNAEAPYKALNQSGDLGLFKDQDKESSPTVNLT